MSSSDSSKKMVTLKSSDGEVFEVEESVAVGSQTINHMIEDGCADSAIPLPNVTGKVLAKVIEYLNHHSGNPDEKKQDLKSFDADFVKVEQGPLFELIQAANYLNVKNLLELTCQAVADMIKDKSPEEVRKIFKIENDFTPEEEDSVRRENAWVFE